MVDVRQEDLMKQLTNKHARSWRRTVNRILRDRDLTEDVVQESWRRVLNSRVNFQTPGDWENYFHRVLINTARDHGRARTRTGKISTTLDGAFHLADHKEDPLFGVLKKERRRRERYILQEVIHLMQALSPAQRQAIVLLINKGPAETLEAISRREGIAISTLRSRMYSGIRRIRRSLIKKGLLNYNDGL